MNFVIATSRYSLQDLRSHWLWSFNMEHVKITKLYSSLVLCSAWNLHLLSIFISGLGQSPRLQPSGPPGLSTFAKLNVPGLCQDSRIQQISPPGLRIHGYRRDFNIDASSVFVTLLICSNIPYIFINNLLASKLMMI